mgnify:CR=1 FL=1
MCVCHDELSKSQVVTQHVVKLRQQHETKLQISREVRDFGEFVRVENSYDYRLLQKNSRDVMVGVERFELPTSCSQSRRATGLRYTPKDIEQLSFHKVVFRLDLDFFCRMC